MAKESTSATEQKNIPEDMPSDKTSEKKKPEKTKSSNGLFIFLILLIVAATAAAGYYFWEQQQAQSKQFAQQLEMIKQLQQGIAQNKQSVKSQVGTSSQLVNEINQLTEKLEQTQDISQRAMEIVNRSRRDWSLAEIDYLLRIAHQRIEVARDVTGAIAALKGADKRLEELSDLNLFKIRKQISKDIASLNAIHRADVSGISLQIDQSINYLTDLPFKSVKQEIKTQITETSVADTANAEDSTFVDSVLDTVKKIGEIKVHQRSIKAASSSEQQTHIEQLLRTYLLSARLAALRLDQNQFQLEVRKSSELLYAHYDEKDNRVEQLLKLLNDYSTLQLSPDLPELNKAWSLLQPYLVNASQVKEKAEATE